MAYKNVEQVMKRILRSKSVIAVRPYTAPAVPVGRASVAWTAWTESQRKHFLVVWCTLSKEQVAVFISRPWYALNGHVRRSVKKFFRQSPVLDLVLGPMRYPEQKA